VNDRNLTDWLRKAKSEHKSLAYFIKKSIITDNLFGVDIMEEATEIARLRLFLALVASARSVDELEPLPNIDFNILTGNSLIGLMHVNDKDFNDRTSQGDLFRKSYREVLAEKNRLIDNYRHTASKKGGSTDKFPAAFMRHEVSELERFPKEGALDIPIELVRRLSPDSLSVMEFKNDMDIHIAEKMLRFPLLGEKIEGIWNLVLSNEFHMTNDSHLFKIEPAPGRLPLYEGKMIHQFTHTFGGPRYWINEKEGRKAILGKTHIFMV
jgi:hypothetical protein